MSEYFLTKKEVDDLFANGPLHTTAGRLAALIPCVLFAVGLIAALFFGIEYSLTQIIFGAGGLLLLSICLPFFVQWFREVRTKG